MMRKEIKRARVFKKKKVKLTGMKIDWRRRRRRRRRSSWRRRATCKLNFERKK